MNRRDRLCAERAELLAMKWQLDRRTAYLEQLCTQLPHHPGVDSHPELRDLAARVLLDRAKAALDAKEKAREVEKLTLAVDEAARELDAVEAQAARLKRHAVALREARSRLLSELSFMRVGFEPRMDEIQRLMDTVAASSSDQLKREENLVWQKACRELDLTRRKSHAVDTALLDIDHELTGCPQEEDA